MVPPALAAAISPLAILTVLTTSFVDIISEGVKLE